jgi:hypothetical protein
MGTTYLIEERVGVDGVWQGRAATTSYTLAVGKVRNLRRRQGRLGVTFYRIVALHAGIRETLAV